MGGAEIFKHRQPFAKVRLNRRFNDFARWLGHEPTHTGQLTDLLHATTGAGVGHQINRIHVARPSVVAGVCILLQLLHHLQGDSLTGVRPGIEHLIIALPVGNHASLIELHDLHYALLCLGNDLGLVGRRNEIICSKR